MTLRGVLLQSAMLLTLGCSASSIGPQVRPAGSPFPAATEVRLFVETDYEADDQTGKFTNPDGLVLTNSQRTELESALVIEPLPEEMAACFVPHHFFRYFGADGEEVGGLAVCFCCDGVQTEGADKFDMGDDEMLGADYGKLKQLVSSMGERTDINCY